MFTDLLKRAGTRRGVYHPTVQTRTWRRQRRQYRLASAVLAA